MTMAEQVKLGLQDAVGDLEHFVGLWTGSRQFLDPAHNIEPPITVRSLSTLFADCVVFGIGLLLLRIFVYPAVASMLGIHAPPPGSAGQAVARKGKKKGGDEEDPALLRIKTEVALRELAFYTYSTVTHLVFYARRCDWVFPNHYEDLYRPSWRGNAVVAREYRITYFFELAWYLVGLFFLITDFKRKDFVAMFVHHLATVFLILGSWHCGYPRTGVVVILLHNVSDVFLQLAKICNYAKIPVLDVGAFICFAVSFGALRLGVYPILIYTAINSIPFYDPDPPNQGVITPGGYMQVVLFVLVFLHVYWMYLIVKMVTTMVLGDEKFGDIREEEENTAAVDGATVANGTATNGSKTDSKKTQ